MSKIYCAGVSYTKIYIKIVFLLLIAKYALNNSKLKMTLLLAACYRFDSPTHVLICLHEPMQSCVIGFAGTRVAEAKPGVPAVRGYIVY